ncbi:Gamma-glutamyl ligase-related protein [Alteracholeplasma palmae J233]|uniref:Gamma-glutamyl ligase-related protein n=1 Tax=Alteracholeplasma palmae (strain ATCC 49389 / J233) TaxID=1318466 RepID=U4KS34_ALTPJ|nr:coenzyme F420-0:L-glutamate ligase [Alteracholeplasma palmae]CCV64681.1 Gamma-glutamyl ligase-related protein [Alteracholeplasma palmae J233]
MKTVGTIARGIRTPIIKTNDNLEQIVIDSILKASKEDGFEIQDKDIIAITEAVVGISMGNYATIDAISSDIKSKFKTGHLGIVFPILSRNRFSILLKAFAKASKKITILLSYPTDEVGNAILDEAKLKSLNINPYSDKITEEEYKNHFSDFKHLFTGVNMVEYYRNICLEENTQVNFVFSNNPEDILDYTTDVLVSSIHSRQRIKNTLKENQSLTVYGLDDILTQPVNGSGYNEKYGLLGSNMATKDKVKLFPNHTNLVFDIQKKIFELTEKTVEVMIYGDGAFKDPSGGIWELADPVVSPSYTSGLEGSPNEIKLKFLSDSKFENLKGKELEEAIKNEILNKDNSLVGKDESLGTTPRKYVDLIGSLCDLMSGSGDKGTPVIFIQNYFTNYTK